MYLTTRRNCSKFKTLKSEKLSFINTSLSNAKTLVCKNGKSLMHQFNNDLVVDCGHDEKQLMLLLIFYEIKSCSTPYQLPCREGHSQCFNISQICIYKLDSKGTLQPCRNGGHLESCQKFECNMKYKCKKSYCISWSYICDGKWDCPDGSDEKLSSYCSYNIYCVNMYKCQSSHTICVHLGAICDQYPDCPLRDDEKFCKLHKIICPVECNCFLFAIECVNMTKQFQVLQYPHVSVSLINTFLERKNILALFPNV